MNNTLLCLIDVGSELAVGWNFLENSISRGVGISGDEYMLSRGTLT